MLSVLAAVVATLLCLLGLRRLRQRAKRDDELHDARISTLVFPPESKFQASGWQRK